MEVRSVTETMVLRQGHEFMQVCGWNPPKRDILETAVLDGISKFLVKHITRLGYYGRLRTERTSSNGTAEGAAKTRSVVTKNNCHSLVHEQLEPYDVARFNGIQRHLESTLEQLTPTDKTGLNPVE